MILSWKMKSCGEQKDEGDDKDVDVDVDVDGDVKSERGMGDSN